MPKIKTYPFKELPVPGDFILGTDSENNNRTVNFRLSTLSTYPSSIQRRKYGIIPEGEIDGNNTVFMLPDTPVSNTVCLYYNNIRAGNDMFTVEDNVLTMAFAPVVGDNLLVDYDIILT